MSSTLHGILYLYRVQGTRFKYNSRWIIFFVVSSHPIHMFYVMQRPALNSALGHTGFGRPMLKEDNDGICIDSFFHYLHHRYFECNYGTITVPLDRWFGTLHDGTPESYERMCHKRRLPKEASDAPASVRSLRNDTSPTEGNALKSHGNIFFSRLQDRQCCFERCQPIFFADHSPPPLR